MSSATQSLSAMPAELPGAEGLKFTIVVADWNKEITHSLLNGAIQTLHSAKVHQDAIRVIHVPGSFELTAGASLAIETHKPHAVICLGCVIQGETRHFEFICQAVANGLTQLTVKHGIPVIFGVLTTDNMEQALARAGGKYGNKGIEAAVTAVQMAALSARP